MGILSRLTVNAVVNGKNNEYNSYIHIGSGDNGEPVFTIMFTDED